jgi:hypothetical protein
MKAAAAAAVSAGRAVDDDVAGESSRLVTRGPTAPAAEVNGEESLHEPQWHRSQQSAAASGLRRRRLVDVA